MLNKVFMKKRSFIKFFAISFFGMSFITNYKFNLKIFDINKYFKKKKNKKHYWILSNTD